MRKVLLIGMAACMVCAGCKDKKMVNAYDMDTEEDTEDSMTTVLVDDTLHLFEEEEVPETVDEFFDDFFYNFKDDAKFQRQRIIFPLSLTEKGETEEINKNDWTQIDRFKDRDILSVIYEREQDYILSKDTSIYNVDVEWIGLKDNRVEKYHFNKVNGHWMLTGIDKKNRQEIPIGGFVDFYARFMADSVFQHESLATPIKVVLTSEDGEEEPQEEFVDAEEWAAIRESIPMPKDDIVNVNYGQASISQNRKVLLMQGISNGLQIRFTFNRNNDKWKLMEIEY